MADQTCNPSIITQALGITATGPRTVIVPADPIEWSAETSYEYLTLVSSADFGQGYVAKKDVPSGTPLTDTDYWIPVASFNAQLVQIQQSMSQVNTDLAGKAPTDHASANTTYGKGTDTVFGHVKLSDTASDSNASAGVAATPSLVKSSVLSDRNYANEHVLLIGDSYLQGIHSASASQNGQSWGDYFEDVLGCTVEKYGNGGSGFWSNGATAPYNGMNYLAMINHIANNYDGDKNAVTGIIFEGGYNDTTNYSAASNEAVVNAVNAAKEAFPNARVMIAFMHCGGWDASNIRHVGNAASAYNYAAKQCADAYGEYINLINVLENPSYDNIHPTEAAQAYLGKIAAFNYCGGASQDYIAGSYQSVFVDDNHIVHAPSIMYKAPVYSGTPVQVSEGTLALRSNQNHYLMGAYPHGSTWDLCVFCIHPEGDVQLNYCSANLKGNEPIYMFDGSYSIF